MAKELTHENGNGAAQAETVEPGATLAPMTAQPERGLMDLMIQGLRGLEAQLAEAEAEVRRLSTEVQHQRGAIGMAQQIKDDAELQAAFLAWLDAE